MPGSAKDQPVPPPSDAVADPSDAPDAPAAAPPRQKRPWRSLLRALLWLLGAEFASVCTAVVMGAAAGISQGFAHIHGAEGWKPDTLFYGLVATLALQATLLFADLKQGRSVGRGDLRLGLGTGPMRRRWLIAVFALLIVAWVIAYVAILVRFEAFNAYVATRVPSVLTLPPVEGSPVVLATMLLLTVAVAPVAEELFFRGWLWTALRRSWGVWPTALWTAGLWLAIHAIDGPVRALILLPTAILLCLARHYGGGVRASLLVHVVNNGTAVGIQIAARLLAG
jgi:membrane protease YdiL (CAAX protease family)